MRISKCFIIALMTLVVSLAQAQKPKNFDPERFQRELEQFIATQACLSPAESAEFFPVYREMRRLYASAMQATWNSNAFNRGITRSL